MMRVVLPLIFLGDDQKDPAAGNAECRSSPARIFHDFMTSNRFSTLRKSSWQSWQWTIHSTTSMAQWRSEIHSTTPFHWIGWKDHLHGTPKKFMGKLRVSAWDFPFNPVNKLRWPFSSTPSASFENNSTYPGALPPRPYGLRKWCWRRSHAMEVFLMVFPDSDKRNGGI